MKEENKSRKDKDTEMRQMISDHIQSIRRQKGWSVNKVADDLGITRSALTQIETSRNNVSAVMIWKLAYLFGCEVGDFFPPTPEDSGLTKADIDKLESDRAKNFARKCFPKSKSKNL